MHARTDTNTAPASAPPDEAELGEDSARQWRSEAVLRARSAGRPSADEAELTLRNCGALVPIEQDENPGIRSSLKRAIAVPALAGGAVFVIAVLIAATMVMFQTRPAAEAAAGVEQALRAPVDGPDGLVDESLTTEHGAAGEAPSDDAASAANPARPPTIYVHVIGEVVAPGVVEVPAGTRIASVIDAAGGATEAAVLAAVNLAREAVDGEQLLVPNAAQASEPQAIAESPGPGSASVTSTVNLNTANSEALQTLPRVGPALAERIIDWREANGGFSSVDQLLDVSGIGEKTFEGLRDQVSVR